MKKTNIRLVLLGSLFAACSASGEQLMVEQFDYTVGGSLSGAAGGSGFGGAWALAPTFGGSLAISSGLSFSDYPVAGNALTFNLTPTGFGSIAGATREIGDLSIPTTGGDFWVSYLYRHNSGGTGGDDSRVSIRDSGGTNDRLILTSRDDLLEQNGGVGINSSDEGGTNNIQTGDVFLLIAKFTNFGNGSAVTPQTGTFWALRPQDYDLAKIGGLTEVSLAANAFSTGSDGPVSTPIGFTTADIVTLNSTIGATSAGYNYTIDELRYGTDLASVVPEPTIGTLSLLGLAAIASRRRVRRRSASWLAS
jgi:hypothetical protein